MRLMSSLTSLAVVRCSVDALVGVAGLFAALRALPHLDEFTFEPATSMLWALYDNCGQAEHAANPFGEDAVLALPPELPKPVPDNLASIWYAAVQFNTVVCLCIDTLILCTLLRVQ